MVFLRAAGAMASFRFDAVDRYGETVGGTYEAADREAARAELERRGWKIDLLELVPDSASAAEPPEPNAPPPAPLRVPRESPPTPLAAGEMTELLDQLAVLTHAGVPLPSGLRAAATEMESTALRDVFERLADRIEAGTGLEAALVAESTRFPAQIRGLVGAGIRTGSLAEILAELVRSADLGYELRRRAVLTVAYPALILGVLLVLVGFVCRVSQSLNEGAADVTYTFRGFRASLVAPDFARALAAITHFVAEYDILLALIAVGLIGVLVLVTRFGFRVYRRRRIAQAIPIVGPMIQSVALAEFCQLAAILVEARVPLPEVLALAGASVRDPALAHASRHLPSLVAAGEPLPSALRVWTNVPAALGQILAWGEQRDDLAGSLRFAGAMFESRAEAQSKLASQVLAGLLLILVFWMLCFALAAIYVPLQTALDVLG